MGDFIRKNIAIEKLNDYAARAAFSDECTEETIKQCVKIIQSVPGIDAAAVAHGKWVNEDFPDKFAAVHDMALCSVCGELADKTEHGYSILHKFCPHCGAKMDLK